MKKLFVALALALCFAPAAFAQLDPTVAQTVTQTVGTGFISTPVVTQGGSLCLNQTGLAISDHTFIFHPHGGLSALTMTATGSTGAGSSTITTSTTATGASVHFTGIYNQVCLVATSITGTGGFVDISYSGINGANAGAVTVTSGAIDATLAAETTKVIGTVRVASGGVASGAIASGAVASGAFASGSLASGAISNGADVAQGTTTDAKCLTTDATACTLVGLTKAVSANTAALAAAIVPAANLPILYDTNTNGKTQLIALSSGKVTSVYGLSITNSSGSAVTVSLGTGTGTNCGSTYTAITPAWVLPVQSAAALQGFVLPNSLVPYFVTAASEELCISTNAGVSLQVLGVASQN